MKRAVISDVHSNLEALEAVLGKIGGESVDEVLFLGDAVGYGPNPNECVEILSRSCKVLLAGNHDWAVLGLTDVAYFNPYAKAAVLWTDSVITPESREKLAGYPVFKNMENMDALLVHSTPKDPDAWSYVLNLWDAEVNFSFFSQKTCMMGHSHQPFIIEREKNGELVTHKDEARLYETKRYMVNVGSVGQPRDGDPRACYAIIDDGSVTLRRVQYDITKTQDMMREVGLPVPLIERLSRGV